MFYGIMQTLIIILLLSLIGSVTYYLFFVFVYYYFHNRPQKLTDIPKPTTKFSIIVPAHNEELLIDKLCQNLANLDYPKMLYEVWVVADNCTDKTADICAGYNFKVLIRNDSINKGKGYALQFAFANIDLDTIDAVLLIDADTTVNPEILTIMNQYIADGAKAIQCNIEIPNRGETWFTQLAYVARTINNKLYHYPKTMLGLSSYIMGSGICFSAPLLKDIKWNAFSLSEDWEFFAKLIEKNYRIHYSLDAVVYAQESRSLRQATTQRLRWSSGRFYVVKKFGIPLFIKGIQKRSLLIFDASLSILFPNLSLQINLIALTAVLILLFKNTYLFNIEIIGLAYILLAQAVTVVAGIICSGQILKVMKAIAISPVFLLWKFFIDFISFTGIYKGKSWVRTKRHIPKA